MKLKLNELKDFIKTTLNESYNSEEGFITDIKKENVSLYGENFFEKFKKFENELLDGEDLENIISIYSAKVFWNLDLDLRSWGVKDSQVVIQKVVVDFDVSSNKSSLTEKVVLDSELDDFKVLNEMNFSIGSAYFPFDLDIDFKDKTITVS